MEEEKNRFSDASEENEVKEMPSEQVSEWGSEDAINRYIKTPNVGDSVEFVVEKFTKRPGGTAKDKGGNTFETGLKTKVDGVERRVKYEILTSESKIFNINSWNLKNAIAANPIVDSRLKSGTPVKGLKMKLTRNYDGQDTRKQIPELMKLRDLKDEAAAKAYVKEVTKAIEEYRLWTVEVSE